MTLPAVTVEIAFDVAGVRQSIGTTYSSLSWTDVTSYVMSETAVTFSRGRAEAGQTAAAGQLTVAFDNSDGRFTPGTTGGPYGQVHTRMPIRVRATTVAEETPVTYTLWLGFVTDIDWQIKAGYPVVVMTASDVIAVAARTKCGPWLTRRVQAMSDLIGYWPCTDTAPNSLSSSTATAVPALAGETARSGITGGTVATVAGNTSATLSFNVTSDVSPDPTTEPVFAFTPVSGSGLYLTSTATLDATGDMAVSMWVRPTSNVSSCLIACKYPGVGVNTFAIFTDSGGTLTVSNAYSGGAYSVTYGTLTDDVWSHLYLERDNSATAPASRFRLWVNGTERTGTASGTATVDANTAIEVSFGGDSLTGINDWNGQMAHVALFDSLDDTRPAFLSVNGDENPTCATRIGQLHYLTPNPSGFSTWLTADAAADNTVSAQAADNKSLLAVCEEVADAERGSIIATREGKLRLLAQRYFIAPAAVTATLSAEADVLSSDGLFGVDDTDNLNQVVITLRPSGWTYTATRANDPGVESATVEVWSTDTAFAESLARQQANADTERPRAPSLSLSMEWLSNNGLADTFLPLELGDTLQIDDLPSQAPATSLVLQVRTITHTINSAQWLLNIDTDPPLYGAVLDDGVRGLLNQTAYLGV